MPSNKKRVRKKSQKSQSSSSISAISSVSIAELTEHFKRLSPPVGISKLIWTYLLALWNFVGKNQESNSVPFDDRIREEKRLRTAVITRFPRNLSGRPNGSRLDIAKWEVDMDDYEDREVRVMIKYLRVLARPEFIHRVGKSTVKVTFASREACKQFISAAPRLHLSPWKGINVRESLTKADLELNSRLHLHLNYLRHHSDNEWAISNGKLVHPLIDCPPEMPENWEFCPLPRNTSIHPSTGNFKKTTGRPPLITPSESMGPPNTKPVTNFRLKSMSPSNTFNVPSNTHHQFPNQSVNAQSHYNSPNYMYLPQQFPGQIPNTTNYNILNPYAQWYPQQQFNYQNSALAPFPLQPRNNQGRTNHF